jgi:hypothetical protein
MAVQHPLSLLRSFLRETLSDTRTIDGGKLQADVAEHYGDVRDDVAELFCLMVPSDERAATLEVAAGRWCAAAASQSSSPLKITLPSSTRGGKPEVFYDQESGRPYSVKGDGETFWLDAPPTSASGGSGVRFAGVATDDDDNIDDDIDDDNDDNDDGDGGGDDGDIKGEVFLDRASGRSYSVSNKTGETFWLDELDSGLQAQYAAQQALADDEDDDEEDDVEDDVGDDAEDGEDGGGGEGGDVFRQSGAGQLGFLQVKPKKGKKGTLMRSQSEMTKKMHTSSLSGAGDRSRSTTVASSNSKGPIRKVNRVLWDKDTGKPYSLDDSGVKCWI